MTMVAESDEPRLLNDVPPPAIETSGLTRAFGDHVAVSNVAFSVRPGEIFGLIGPNSAGKSTLVKMLTTMLAISAMSRNCSANAAEAGGVAGYFTQVFAVADAEVRKLRHDPSELFTRALQPAIWLLLFGEVMAQVRGLATGNGRYIDFLAPGILAQSVLFSAIFYGIAAIWERDLGVLHRYMVSPAPRTALVLGKAASSGVRGLSQAAIVYLLSLALGVNVSLAPGNILGAAAMIIVGSALFSTFSLIVACIVKTRDRFMGVGQVLTMPLFFASNAIYPIAIMPGWLRAVSSANPLTYQVDALRALMLEGSASAYGLPLDFAVLVAFTAVLTLIAARLYPRLTS